MWERFVNIVYKWVKPEIMKVVSTFKSIICIVLLVGKKKFKIEFVPTKVWVEML
jgi:hypothetical protein